MNWTDYKSVLTIITVLVISVVSGFISISQRIVRGMPASKLWIVSEFAAAILCGYLMYDAYPMLHLPEWATMPMLVAICAHTGGRLFQEAETYVRKNYEKFLTP